MVRKILIIIILTIPLFLNAQPFEVLSQNENELIVKFTLPNFEFENIETKRRNFTIINCPHSINSTKAGFPLLPYFSEIVGLPIDGDVEFQIIGKKQRVKNNVKMYPTERLIDSGNSVKYEFYQNKKAYNTSKLYPAKLIVKGEPAYIRDRYFTGFNVYPFQYKARSNELIITTELTFRISILGDKSVSRQNYLSSNNFIDEIGDSFFLNNEFSKKWRKEKEIAATTPPFRNGDLVNEIQFIINEEGIYKITYDHLIEALSDPDYPIEFEMEFDWDEIDPHNIELSDENGPVPIHFVGEGDGSFDPGDYFEFFGDRHYGEERYYDDYTAENVYTLKLLDIPGSRMAVENGGLGNIQSGQFIIPESFQQTVHFEQQNTADHLGAQFIHNSHDYYREDIWFWDKINAPTLEIYPFELQYPEQTNIRTFYAEVCLFSTTFDEDNYYTINHLAQVNLNSSLINQHEWHGQTEKIFENIDNPIPNSYLEHGTNNIYISLPGIPGIEHEQVLLDYFELTYWREYKTDDDYLKFTKPQNKPLGLFQFQIDNFSSDQVSVYKIGCSYIENVQITAFSGTGTAPYQVAFQDSLFSHNTEYVAVTEANKKLPKRIIPNIPSSLKDPFNIAHYIIITIQEFAENEGTLQFKQIWESQGKIVKIVSLEDIFDEFNHGIRSAEAIKDFLSYAYN
ncbi:MAG: hypothetical protein KAW88_06790, partial [Candidatus Cloacimonetes bacterium]|nr:hypothetical protein [Candidatus Cloacimonadota bacterium]